MIEMKTKLKKWGNSFGVVIPINSVEQEGAKEGDDLIVLVKKEKGNVLRETFGTSKSKKSVKELMKEIDEDLDFG